MVQSDTAKEKLFENFLEMEKSLSLIMFKKWNKISKFKKKY